MDTRDDTAQTNEDIKNDSSTFVALGWPLAITICSTIIVFGVLGNLLVWWTRTRGFYGGNNSTTSGYRDLESQSGRQRSLLPGLRWGVDQRVLVKKRHLRSRATLSNHTRELTGDCATMRSLPTLPVLPKHNAFDSGRTSTSTNCVELSELRNSHKRRRASIKSTKSAGNLSLRRRSTHRPPLPILDVSKHGFRNWATSDPAIHRAKSCPNEPHAKTRQRSGLQKAHRYPVQSSSDGDEGHDAAACLTPTTSLGYMPHYSKPITPKMSAQDLHGASPTAASISRIGGSSLPGLPDKPPQALRRDMLPWSPGQMAINPTESRPHVGVQTSGHPVDDDDHFDNPFRSTETGVSTASRSTREQRSASFNPDRHQYEVRAGESYQGLPSQEHQRHLALSLASGTSSARSASYSVITSQYEPFYLQNLIAQPASPPPPPTHGVATPAVNWNAWRQLNKQRPLSRAKTASWVSDVVSARAE